MENQNFEEFYKVITNEDDGLAIHSKLTDHDYDLLEGMVANNKTVHTTSDIIFIMDCVQDEDDPEFMNYNFVNWTYGANCLKLNDSGMIEAVKEFIHDYEVEQYNI